MLDGNFELYFNLLEAEVIKQNSLRFEKIVLIDCLFILGERSLDMRLIN